MTLSKRHIKAHFGFVRIPFSKYAWAKNMFDSSSQRELFDGLVLWLDLHGIALVTGPSGVGKSITVRRVVQASNDSSFRVFAFSYLPTTVMGFLRLLNRKLGLPMRQHSADLFDQAQKLLITIEKEQGPHPVLLIDDAEGLSISILDVLRRLTSYELDAEDRFSLLLVATDDMLTTLRHPSLAPLCSRIGYAHTLRPFALEDARNYVQYHLARAECDPKLISDEAVRHLFQASMGKPRNINQLAMQALINAAVMGRDKIDGDFMAKQIAAHPLYHLSSNPQ